MRVSIALCTYNGARFLGDQLDSIAAQTMPPDELIVCDDGSTDGTLAILEAFAADAPFPVRITANSENLGVVQNFGKVIGLCTGDLIALSDQDDVWRSDKLETLMGVLADHPDTGLIFSNAAIVREDLTPTGEQLFTWAGVTEKERAALRAGQAFELLLKRNIVTGATVIFRAKFRPLVIPIPSGGYLAHDAWIALLISAAAPIMAYDAALIQYRQHTTQAQGLRDTAHLWKPEHFYKTHLQQLAAISERLAWWETQKPTSGMRERQARLQMRMQHLRFRINLPRKHILRAAYIVTELWSGRYSRFSNGFYSAARDLIHRG